VIASSPEIFITIPPLTLPHFTSEAFTGAGAPETVGVPDESVYPCHALTYPLTIFPSLSCAQTFTLIGSRISAHFPAGTAISGKEEKRAKGLHPVARAKSRSIVNSFNGRRRLRAQEQAEKKLQNRESKRKHKGTPFISTTMP
jgi:hypothetical protein